jgi:lysozyme
VHLKDQLRRDEGDRDIPYWDCCGQPWTQTLCPLRSGLAGHTGHLTVGVGWNLRNPLPFNVRDQLLEISIARARRECETLPEYAGLSPARRDAVTNMVFNMGLEGYKTFVRAQAHLQRGEYTEAAAEFLDSKWATQVGDRAKRIAQQIREDRWI